MPYSKIGKIQNTHGLDGRLVIKHIFEKKDAFQKLKHVFIEILPESYIPYFIEENKLLDASESLVRLDEVSSVEIARELLGKNVFIENDLFRTLKPKNITDDFIGYAIIDTVQGNLGAIQNLFETPGQVIASVNYKDKELLIPLLEHTIIDINTHLKTIKVNLPEGLIDIYLD